MADKKKEYLTKWTVISFVIGTLIGTGSIWQYFDYVIKKEKLKNEAAETTTNLRSQRELLLKEIIDLTNTYLDIQKNGPNVPEVHNRLNQIKARLELLKDNANSLEQKIASLEHREPNNVNLNFFPPSPPMNLTVQ